MKSCYSRTQIDNKRKTAHIHSLLTLKYGIGGWKNWHVHSRVVGVGQSDDTVSTVMCDAPIVI